MTYYDLVQILSICEDVFREFLTVLPEKADAGMISLLKSISFDRLSFLELCRDLHYPEDNVKQVRVRKQLSDVNRIMDNIFVIPDRFIINAARKWERNALLNLICRLMEQFGDNYSVWICIDWTVHH